ncbi:efflux RND transporter periplasmic adaptor subunit [Geothrix fermentans]|uniref:efflux RND transporter periplasmic adaptor subunit n=1 Tax=Geothrix fermentans TaxID=44676 RepID=UPI0004096929|nr:efflux RND transporter periplasmic adaptor subunit [Geothrix fermentans]
MSLRLLLPASMLILGALPAQAGALLEGQVLPFRQVEVSAPVSSQITEMRVKEGEAVKAGQALALLYGKLEELEMQRAKALLERREFEAKGAKRLYDSKVIPEARALESRIDLELARLQYETAAEQVRLRTILAPMDGVVVTRYRDAGEAVSGAQPLFRLMDLSRVLIQCAADPSSLAGLVPGRKVRVLVPEAGGAARVEGEVVLVDPCADATGKIRIRILVPNPEGRIRAGLKAQVQVPEGL